MTVSKLSEIFDELKKRDKKRLVAACANDSHTIGAVSKAIDLGIIDATLVGDMDTIKKVCEEENIDPSKFEIIQESDDLHAAAKAVDLVRNGKGDFLMKGLVSTDKYMRAILNKERGLLPPKALLTHIAVIENPAYRKLLIVTDSAIIPLPELGQKIKMINYLVRTALKLGIEKPKVAVIASSEQVLPNIPANLDGAVIAKMAERGQIKGAFVEGPIALDVAIDREAAKIKGMKSEVAGDADCLLFPNIEAANVFYKTNTKFCKAEVGSIVAGAMAPAILSSRGDSVETKLYSIALAALLA